MTERRRLVRVPASTANLGPGYDVLAAALSLHLELEVVETGEFGVDPGDASLPAGRDNLCVRAFESLHPADGLSFRVRSQIPVAAGLGSSAAAIVAGLMAADHLYELALSKEDLVARGAEVEGHPDNVAAAVHGGFVICDGSTGPPSTARFDPPSGIEAVVVIPGDEVPTGDARDAMPEEIPLADAVANIASASTLVLGLATGELDLIARGLRDRLHQPRRAHLYPRSIELIETVRAAGAIGATISGAGPTVLVWTFWQQTGQVHDSLRERTEGWAEVWRVPFAEQGADVTEL